jgi:hypothetical protein
VPERTGLGTSRRVEVTERDIQGDLIGSPGPDDPICTGLGGGESDAVGDRVGEGRPGPRERKYVDHHRQAPRRVGHREEVQVGQVDDRVLQGARAG